MKRNALPPLSILASLIIPISFGDDADDVSDKGRHNLFNPAPENLLRELATDRPDKTEEPGTVDAGHFQFEVDFATFTFDRTSDVQTGTWNVAPFNLGVRS